MVYNSSEWRKVEDPDVRAMLQYIDGHVPENSPRAEQFALDVKRFKEANKAMEDYMDMILMQTDWKRMGHAEGLRDARAEMQPIIDQKDAEISQKAAEIAALKAQLEKYQQSSK